MEQAPNYGRHAQEQNSREKKIQDFAALVADLVIKTKYADREQDTTKRFELWQSVHEVADQLNELYRKELRDTY